MNPPLTITQLAKRLGLSTCTVSRAINNTPGSGLSAATRQRVLREAGKLGYRPNLSAQALVNGKTRVLGAISINANNPFMSGFIYGVEETARQTGYHVLLCNTRSDTERERNEVAMLRPARRGRADHSAYRSGGAPPATGQGALPVCSPGSLSPGAGAGLCHL